MQAGRVVRLTGGIGQLAQAGQSLAMLVPDDIWVTANFKETQITDMRPDQPVDIEIDAYPGRKIQGTVASVQPGSGTAFSLLPAQNATGNYVKVTQRIPVKIVVKNWPTGPVRPRPDASRTRARRREARHKEARREAARHPRRRRVATIRG